MTARDVIVIGGSYAGLSAALQLARARRSVLVIDAGQPRNRRAAESHGFLGHDGRAPGAISADAREQLLEYGTAELRAGVAAAVRAIADGFEIRVGGDWLAARRLILATGTVDELPEIPGLADRWGHSVFHCPYCHAYELGGRRMGVIAAEPAALHQALLLSDWGEVTLLLNHQFEPDAAMLSQLEGRGVTVVRVPIVRISGNADTALADGRTLEFAALFITTRHQLGSPLAEQLGCEIVKGSLGPYIKTNAFMGTSVGGVYACGDTARESGSIAVAVGDGAIAGIGAHQSLIAGLT